VTDELAVHVLDEVAEPKRVHDEVRDIRTSLEGTHTGVDQRVLHVQPRAIHADATKLVRVHRAVDTEERGRARRRLWNPLRDAGDAEGVTRSRDVAVAMQAVRHIPATIGRHVDRRTATRIRQPERSLRTVD